MAQCVALSVPGVKERRKIDGISSARATISLPRTCAGFFHKERSTHCTINTTTFLARFLAVVRVEIIQRDVHDMFVRVPVLLSILLRNESL